MFQGGPDEADLEHLDNRTKPQIEESRRHTRILNNEIS